MGFDLADANQFGANAKTIQFAVLHPARQPVDGGDNRQIDVKADHAAKLGAELLAADGGHGDDVGRYQDVHPVAAERRPQAVYRLFDLF